MDIAESPKPRSTTTASGAAFKIPNTTDATPIAKANAGKIRLFKSYSLWNNEPMLSEQYFNVKLTSACKHGCNLALNKKPDCTANEAGCNVN